MLNGYLMNQNISRDLFNGIDRAIEWITRSHTDSDELRLQKKLLVHAGAMMSLGGIVWGLLTFFNDEVFASLFPFGYSIISFLNLGMFRLTQRYQIFRFIHLLNSLMLPFLLLVALGGYVNSGAVVFWSLVTPLGATLLTGRRQAIGWFVAFLAVVVISALINPFGREANNLPQILVLVFFVMNVMAPSTLAIVLILYFLNQKDMAQKLLEQEQEALRESEIMLRQTEKMAQLGTLSAGVAHELNNPAAAVSRSSEQLQPLIVQLLAFQSKLNELALTETQREMLQGLTDQYHNRGAQPSKLNGLAHSDREHEVGTWLEARGINDAWEIAPGLVDLDYDIGGLTKLASQFDDDQFSVVLDWLHNYYMICHMLSGIGEGVGRISEIVEALKSYTYLDQASVQEVDIHEGLDNTLTILHDRLQSGITVRKEYGSMLPKIQAHGSELNQVWTNIISNAAYALGGEGEITIRTSHDGDWVVLDIEDNGPGIPPENQSRVFDAFFTTKPPGQGTGLGLNTSYNIVVQQHRGDIKVFSEPGKTCFQVRLPIDFEAAQKE